MNLKEILNATRQGNDGIRNYIESEILKTAEDISRGMYRGLAEFDSQTMEDIVCFLEQNKERKRLEDAVSVIQKAYNKERLNTLCLELHNTKIKLEDGKINIFNKEIDSVIDKSKECFDIIKNKKNDFDKDLVKEAVKSFKEFSVIVFFASTEEIMREDDASQLKEDRGNYLYKKINAVFGKNQESKDNVIYM